METQKEATRQCRFCKKTGNKKSIRTHTLTHFYQQIVQKNPNLPLTPPYKCPKCSFISENRGNSEKYNLVRHFAFHHNAILKHCKSEDLQGTLVTNKKKRRYTRKGIAQTPKIKTYKKDENKGAVIQSKKKNATFVTDGTAER